MLKQIKNWFQSENQNQNSSSYPAFSSWFSNATLGETDYLNLYKGWIFTATNAISDAVVDLDYQLLSSKGSEKILQDKRILLINSEVLRTISSLLKISGNCFYFYDKVENKLDLLRPDLVHIETNNLGQVTGYRYSFNGNQILYAPDDILAFHNFNPLSVGNNSVKGISEVQAIAIQAESDNATLKWNWNYFKNNASVANILKSDQVVSQVEKDRVLSSWKSEFQGVENAHKTAFLDRGTSLESFSPSQKEMDFVNQRQFTRDEILAIFKVPKAIIGMGEGVNVGNVEAFNTIFAKRTIQPLAKQIAEVFNKTIFKDVGYFEFINIVPTDKIQLRADFEAGVITINEYRKEIGKEKIKNGDVLKLNSFEIYEANAEIKELKEDEKKYKQISKTITKEFLSNVKGTEEFEQKRWEKKIKRNDSYEDRYEKQLLKIYNLQEKDIMKDVKKGYKTTKPKWESLKYLALYHLLVGPEQEDLVSEEGTIALNEVGITGAFVIGDETVKKYLRDNINKFAREIDLNTKNQIFDIIDKGNKEGLGADEISRNVKKVFTTLKTTRIKTIVRTETIRASSWAQEKAWLDSEVVESKEWWTAEDERVCPNCGPMHSKIITLGNRFFTKGEKAPGGLILNYEDINGPALHPNCRCSLIPKIIK